MILDWLETAWCRRVLGRRRLDFTRLRHVLTAAGLIAVSVALPRPAGAAAPPNDVCSGAVVIPPDAGAPQPYLTAATDLLEATSVGDPTNDCVDTVDRGVWFRFAPAQSAFFTLSTWSRFATNTTVEDTVMAIYTSVGDCSGAFEQLPSEGDTFGCNDDLSDTVRQSTITTLLLAGTTYYILIWRFDDEQPPVAGATRVQLHVVKTSSPANDSCANPCELYPGIPDTGSTVGATNDYQLDGASEFPGVGHLTPAPGDLRDVVYAFTAPAAGAYSFHVLNLSVVNDFVIYLLTNCPAAGPPALIRHCLAAANRNPFGAEEICCQPLAAHQRVYVVVDENLNADYPYRQGGRFRIEVVPCSRETEPNGAPTNAIPFACGIEGSADPRYDVDCYSLGTFPVGSRLFALVDGSAANGTKDFDLRVTTASETLEFDDSDNESEFGDFSPNISGLPLPREPVFLNIESKLTVPAEPYRVFAVVQPSWIKASPETEPNQDLLQADTAPANYFRGTLSGPSPSADVDTFAFQAGSGELVFVALDGNPHRNNVTVDAALELFDATGNLLIAADSSSSVGIASSTNRVPGSLTATEPFSPSDALVYRVMDGGSYYVKVFVSSGTATNVGAGDYLLSISKNCAGTIQPNHPVAFASLIAPTFAYEGAPATVSGTLLDADPLDTHAIIVDWGDAVETNELGPGVLSFQLTHPYSDDDPCGSPADVYYPTLVALDEAGAAAITNFIITVANVAPILKTLDLSTQAPFENQLVTLSGAFTDPGTGDIHRIRIAWGDGTTDTLELEPGRRTFAALHAYLDDSPTATPADPCNIRVELDDDDGGTDDESAALTVHNAPPQVTGQLASPVWPQSTILLNVTATDPSPLDTLNLTLDWGDGSLPESHPLPAGGGVFVLEHVFMVNATNLAMHLTLVDDDSGTGTDTVAVQIRPVPAQPRVLSLTRLSNSHFLLTIIQATPGATYRIEISSDLTVWTALPGSQQTADGNGFILFQDPLSPTGASRYYRVVWP
ncbi:MAG: hypothetical protein JXQ71_14215 [Verrucomicrobia bacterium]|nr:hypothetical protein [Verrucomicrobiota bacterium]